MQRHEDNLRLGTEVGEMCLIRELVGKYVLMKIKLGHHRYDESSLVVMNMIMVLKITSFVLLRCTFKCTLAKDRFGKRSYQLRGLDFISSLKCFI